MLYIMLMARKKKNLLKVIANKIESRSCQFKNQINMDKKEIFNFIIMNST